MSEMSVVLVHGKRKIKPLYVNLAVNLALCVSFALLLSFPADLYGQKKLKAEVEALRLEAKQIEEQYWASKQESLRQRKNITDDLAIIDAQLDQAYKSRNSFIEESFLTLENLEKTKELYETERNNQESLLGTLLEEVEKESSKLQASLPRLLEGGLAKLSTVDKTSDITAMPQVLTDLVGYKQYLIEQASTAELYRADFFDATNQESFTADAVRLGFIHSAYAGDNGQVGVLIRSFDTAGASYSWETTLPDGLKSEIDETIVSLKGADGEPITFSSPIDVAGAGQRTRSLLQQDQAGLISSALNFFVSGGFLMYPLLIVAVIALFISIERSLFYYTQRPKGAVDAELFGLHLSKGRLDEAKDALTKLPSRTRVAFVSLIDRLGDHGDPDILINETLQKTVPAYEKRLTTLAVLGSIAPLLGLLGTVSGMITLFDVITVYGTNNPKVLAGGISIALVTTQAGLGIAIPVLLTHHFLKLYKNRMVERLEAIAEVIYVSFTADPKSK